MDTAETHTYKSASGCDIGPPEQTGYACERVGAFLRRHLMDGDG